MTVDQKRKSLFLLALLLSLTGLADSIYLTVQHLSGQSVRCAIVTGCSVVLASRYSSVAGIPTAAFGVAGYFAAFSLATLALYGSALAVRLLRIVVATMLATTIWLLYLQAFVLRAFCAWCLLSAALTTLLTLLVLLERLASRRGSL
ncbi:MAG: vitamin K epoxide reductase family protein [Acidobacteria bacterium]|nr:vitamin K epoxide reductase family protein [Acidobacteriota bacterium]